MPKEPKNPNKAYVIYLGVGMSFCVELAAAMGLGWWIGTWIGKKWGLGVWPAMIGIILFFCLSFWHGMQSLIKLQERLEKDDKKDV